MIKQRVTDKKSKHVIILGAGASVTSGYPIANDLRLLLTSEQKVREELQKQGKPIDKEIDLAISPMFRGTAEKISPLFRDGCFATVDEFSNLAGAEFPKEVQALKRRVRFALALHNPEDKYADSDYYRFIQKLFRGAIFPLRTDVAILTFNYDAYLPFLLRRAVQVRCKAAGNVDMGSYQHCLTSGFERRDLSVLESGSGMCLLQLHGMIAWPDRSEHEHSVSFHDLFYSRTKDRFTKLHTETPPPIVFPWEVIDKKGKFRSKAEFCLQEACDERGARQGNYSGEYDIHDLFGAIWKRACKEINAATKISFIGLSMHDFLNPAFKFLFHGKKNDAKIIFASKELENFKSVREAYDNPRSPVFKLRRLLKTIWPKMKGGMCSDGMVNVGRRETFAEFIQYDMD